MPQPLPDDKRTRMELRALAQMWLDLKWWQISAQLGLARIICAKIKYRLHVKDS